MDFSGSGHLKYLHEHGSLLPTRKKGEKHFSIEMYPLTGMLRRHLDVALTKS
jgi:hypothetical protein